MKLIYKNDAVLNPEVVMLTKIVSGWTVVHFIIFYIAVLNGKHVGSFCEN